MSLALPPAPPHTQLLELMKLRLAAEYLPRGSARALLRLVAQCEAGERLQAAVEADDWRGPRRLRALLQQALATADPGQVVLEIARHESQLRRLWRSAIGTFAYPLCLLLFTLGILAFIQQLVSGLAAVDADLWFSSGEARSRMRALLEDQRNTVHGVLFLAGWMAFFSCVIGCIAAPLTRANFIGSLPLVGAPYRWLQLSRLLTHIAAFSRQQPPLPQVLERVADSLEGEALSPIARHVSTRLVDGEYLGFALHASKLSDMRAGALLTALDAGDQTLEQRCAVVASQFVRLATLWLRRAQVLVPILLLLTVACLLGSTLTSYFTALILWITMLT
jgi:type II secretory pathway component PulF